MKNKLQYVKKKGIDIDEDEEHNIVDNWDLLIK